MISYSQATQAKGLFESLFGSEEDKTPKGPPPEETLQAPFPTNSPTTSKKSQLMDIYGSETESADTLSDLGLPHRNEKQIIEWATEIVSQAMTVNPKTYEEDFKKIAPFFTAFSLKEYNDYMAKTNMINVLVSNSYRLQAMSDEEGSVVKDGKITGTYHWLVQVPIMVSYYKDNIQDVDKTATVTNQHLLVQVQVGRVKQKNGSDIGMAIERWSVSSNAKK
jgi:hypothetical protein